MPRRMWVLCLVLPLALSAAPARADLVLSIGSTPVAQGGTGTIDVLLTSTAPMSAPDAINFYGFQLQITNNGVDNTQLAFSSSQNFGYVSNASLNPAYVFLGDSLAAQSVPPFLGSPTQTVYPNDTFIGVDATNSTNPVLLSAGTTYLLAILSVTASTPAPPMTGDSFTISLVPPSGNGSISSNTNTVFDNFNFNTGTEVSATLYTSTSGTVSIVGAAVPEPASIVLGLAGLILPVGIMAFKRRRAARR